MNRLYMIMPENEYWYIIPATSFDDAVEKCRQELRFYQTRLAIRSIESGIVKVYKIEQGAFVLM